MRQQKKMIMYKKEAICELYPKLYEMTMCLAKRSLRSRKKDKSRGKKPHLYCRRRAMPGTGRCPKHGGLSTGSPPKHGRYSKYVKGELAEIFNVFRNDPDVMSLLDELAMLRLRLARILEIATDRGNFESAKATATIVKAIGDTIEKIYKIESATLGTETIPVIITQIVNVVNENLEFCPHCNNSLVGITKNIFEDLKKVNVIDVPTRNKGNGKF